MTLTRDDFLGGRLSILQPAKGYRAGVDPVFLAAFVTALPGQSVLELGCGVGVASLALQSRVGGLLVTGLELQDFYADLARRNAARNGLPMQVITGDLSDMPVSLRARQFDHVITNPPYYLRDSGTPSRDPGRETARAEIVSLASWIDTAIRRLGPRGTLSVIQKSARLPDLLACCNGRLGQIEVLPLQPRAGRPASLILLRARKGARGEFRLLAPITLHEGARHERDGETYSPAISDVLRNGEAFSAK